MALTPPDLEGCEPTRALFPVPRLRRCCGERSWAPRVRATLGDGWTHRTPEIVRYVSLTGLWPAFAIDTETVSLLPISVLSPASICATSTVRRRRACATILWGDGKAG